MHDLNLMLNPYDPTDSELTQWAFSPGATCPVDDWDIIITNLDRAELMLGLAADDTCPSRDFFLGCLYRLIGDEVHAGTGVDALRRVGHLLEHAERLSDERVVRWAERSRALIAHPQSFDYDTWCASAKTDDSDMDTSGRDGSGTP